MTLSYTTGLTIGSVLAYMLDACLGPPLTAKQICPKPGIPSVIAVTPFNVTTKLLTTVAPTTTARVATTSAAATSLVSTLATIEKVTKKVSGVIKKVTKAPKIKTTATTLTSLFTTALVTSTSESIFHGDAGNLTTTSLPDLLSNVTSAYQHH